jgi:cytochrome P450
MSRSRLPPGPQFSLVDPRLIPFAVGWLRDPYSALLRAVGQHGEIVFVRMGPVQLCILNHPRYVKEVLITRQRQFVKGGAFYLARSVLGLGLLTSDGEYHLRQRRLAQPAFHPHRIATYARTMVAAADQMRQAWRPGQTIDVFREMSHLTLTIASETLFGVHIAGKTDEVRLALTEVLQTWKHAMLPMANALHRYGIPVPAGKRLKTARARLDAILYQVITEKRTAAEPGDDLLSMLAHAADDEGRMTDEQLRDEAMTFMLAGHETMATTLAWMWYLVSQHPEVGARMAAEADGELGDHLPTYQDLPRLTYTRKVFAETLRLYPALWGFTRRALEDIPLGPYVIPKGSQVLASPYVVHRNPQVYTDPLRFDPDRWRDDETFESPDLSYFPFGGGIRRCMGESFAWAEGPLVTATLAQHWRLEHVSTGQPVRPAPSFICRPQGQLLMTLASRRNAPAASCDAGVAATPVLLP